MTVRSGETLFAISRRTEVPVRALIDANSLKPPYRLLAGQRIVVPANRFHEVQPGETLYSVSRRYGVAMSVLVRDNDLDAPYGVRAGERLKIPSVSAPETMVASLPPPTSNPQHVLQLPPSAAPQPQPGQVLRPPPDAAAPPQVLRPPPDAVPQVGSLPPSETAPPAGVLTLPPGYAPDPVLPPAVPSRTVSPPPEAAPPAAPPAPEPPAPAPTRAGRRAPPVPAPPPVLAAPAPPAAPAPAVPPRSAPPAMAAVAPPVVPVLPPAAAGPPPREGRGFIWPVRGQVVTRFGPAGRGLHNDGINIAAPRGTTVVAAEAGIVAYAGNELRGFGNLLLIKHADGWITAYAHNESLLVKRGDRIRRGQPVARVGQTGNVGEPQLHFELRRGTRAVDPTEHLDNQATDAGPASRTPAPDGAPGASPAFRRRPSPLLAALPGPG
ncbi:hypothetical protein STVA_37790 [Allostella vacuolata]|nr:hypothetical protein STVA_37790 [Stella vacuolata]